jgi:fibronectin type 3 domain-containing protein
MHRQLIDEGEEFAQDAEKEVFETLKKSISTKADRTIAVFNPLNWKRTDMVTVKLPKGLECSTVVDNTSGEPIQCHKLTDDQILFKAENIPSLGYKTFSISSMKYNSDSSVPDVVADKTTLENKFYKISFDEKTGGIASIYDKQLDKELVDQDSKYKLNEYLYHYSPDGADGDWYSPQSAVLLSQSDPVSGSMTAVLKAKGVHGIKETVRIYADIKRIDFQVEMDKASTGRQFSEYSEHTLQKKKEAVFYSFPLNIDDFNIRHELAGAVVEPIADQSPGSNTDYYSIQHFSDISGKDYGVTLATVEAGLVEYGRPIPSTTFTGRSDLKYPENSHMFLYLMNNWFFTNICFDQPGLKNFTWSLRSHKGDWRNGEAHKFGWDVSHPLTAMVIEASQKGPLPSGQFSFVEVDSEQSNVVLTTMKSAEDNGSGYILRFNELIGIGTSVSAKLNFIDNISKATETSLIEMDRPSAIKVSEQNRITFDIRPNGVKTIRVMLPSSNSSVKKLKARGVSDMGIDLSWKPADDWKHISYYKIYRHTSPDFEPGLRYFVGQTAAESFSDRPKLNYGGWKNNYLQAETSYYYKVCAVDRGNNRGESSETVMATTLSSNQKNEISQKVAGLKVDHVSPNDTYNVVSIWFYTNSESGITCYRIYRSLTPAFKASDNNLVTEIDLTDTIMHTLPHKFDVVERQLREYDRQMYVDEDVEYGQTYYYKVCAVDNSGQSGPLSDEISINLTGESVSGRKLKDKISIKIK